MNIIKFLLIDSVLLIAAIQLLFLLQRDKKNLTPRRNSNKEELLRHTSIELPGKEKLIKLEKHAIEQGSGIRLNSLIGNWKFASVWKKDKEEKKSLFSSLLRVFSANIEFKKDTSSEDLYKFSIITSIKFGILTIAFSGSGFLSGERPILLYFFNVIELNSGSNVLLRKTLREPIAEEKSVFALIAIEESGKWLSARSQGGELVLWLKG